MQRRTWDVLIDLVRTHVGEPTSGAEIGVYRAQTSVTLLRQFPDCHLSLIDPWQYWPPESSWAQMAVRTGGLSADQWETVYNQALRRLKRTHQDNYTIHRMTSKRAAQKTPDKSFDFVFIDANHSYKSVLRDIRRWTPKTKTLICGHDYGGPYKGVRRAVRRCFGKDFIAIRKARIWAKVLHHG